MTVAEFIELLQTIEDPDTKYMLVSFGHDHFSEDLEIIENEDGTINIE